MRAQVPAQGAQVGAGARPLARASGAQVARKSPLGKERAQVTFVPRKCARKWRASPLRGSTLFARVYIMPLAPQRRNALHFTRSLAVERRKTSFFTRSLAFEKRKMLYFMKVLALEKREVLYFQGLWPWKSVKRHIS